MKGANKEQRNMDEVEEMLRAAEDDLLLNLTRNSHTTANSALDPDLARRFNALKSPSPPARSSTPSSAAAPPSAVPDKSGGVGEDSWDDLAKRFTALKGGSAPGSDAVGSQMPNMSWKTSKDESGGGDGGEDGVSKEEVDKLMQWAVDAARLNPGNSGDEDDDDDEDEEEEDSDDGVEAKEKKKKKAAAARKGKEPKKWFFF